MIDFYQIRSPLSQMTEERMGQYIQALQGALGEELRRVELAQYLQDEFALRRFLEALQLFIDMEQNTPALSGEDLKRKWQLNKDYADRLIDEGGVSTDLFTEALGAENTRRFFDEVFFAPACYR